VEVLARAVAVRGAAARGRRGLVHLANARFQVGPGGAPRAHYFPARLPGGRRARRRPAGAAAASRLRLLCPPAALLAPPKVTGDASIFTIPAVEAVITYKWCGGGRGRGRGMGAGGRA
jgi:hypothetical protein